MTKVINNSVNLNDNEMGAIQRDGLAAHAWVRCQGNIGSNAIDGSYGVTSMTNVATGRIGFSFLYPMDTTDYIAIGNINVQMTPSVYGTCTQDTTNLSTTRSDFWVTASTTLSDPNRFMLAVFGRSAQQ